MSCSIVEFNLSCGLKHELLIVAAVLQCCSAAVAACQESFVGKHVAEIKTEEFGGQL